eukprot:COSAG04_NODE_561_length_12576_cov_258.320910_5_plen_84_part_00
MVGGWHNKPGDWDTNIQVGAHAYSEDGVRSTDSGLCSRCHPNSPRVSVRQGHTWVDTGVAFNLTVDYTDGSSTTFIQRERPHM